MYYTLYKVQVHGSKTYWPFRMNDGGDVDVDDGRKPKGCKEEWSETSRNNKKKKKTIGKSAQCHHAPSNYIMYTWYSFKI